MNAEKFTASLRRTIYSGRHRKAWGNGLSIKEAYVQEHEPNIVFVKLSDKSKWRITVTCIREGNLVSEQQQEGEGKTLETPSPQAFPTT